MASARHQAQRYGRLAETLASAYLRCKGYRILARNLRNHYGEIDIVARRGTTLVAVEVKARRHLADCAQAVTPLQQQRIARALQSVLAKSTGLAGAPPGNMSHDIRFDVIWLARGAWPVHIKDAWRL
ncbi:MAG: YraN family protein [Proteobacteria bacterium]|nr:YraN family protein [Pseudomonadota bacterium]